MRGFHRSERWPSGPIAMSLVQKVSLEDRLQDQLHRGLRHAIPNGRDAEWSRSTSRFRDQDSAHGRRDIRLFPQLFPEPSQKLIHAHRNIFDADSVDTGGSTVGAAALPGVSQDVRSVDLVIKRVESEAWLQLRLLIQPRLKLPDTDWGC
jgi:hypothetical protein